MASINHNCPRCSSKGAAFLLLYDVSSPNSAFEWYTVGKCGVCLRASLFNLRMNSTGSPPCSAASQSITAVISCDPAPAKPNVPDNIPDNVATPYLEAEHSFAAGHYSAAGSCYRKAMERSLKHIDPNLKGMLNQRVRLLEKNGLLPIGMIELLDQIRLFGNTSMHEDDFDPTKADCEAAREFSQLFLTYAFSLPKKVANAKTKIAGQKSI